MPLRQREFPGLAVRRQMGFPCSTLLQFLNFTRLFVVVRKLTGMQRSIGNLQYNIAEMWGQIAFKQFLCSLSFLNLQSKTNLVVWVFSLQKKTFTPNRGWGGMVLKRCKV